MRGAVYNSAIPNLLLNAVNCTLRTSPGLRVVVQLLFVILGMAIAVRAVDWNGPEQQLALKIVAVTGPGAVALTVENRSSLGRRDSEVIQNGLRSALEGLGIRFVKAEQAATTITISLSEDPTAYVWVAAIRPGAGEVSVVMISAPRPEGSTAAHDSVPLSLRKVALWTQQDPILDVAVLEESTTPTRIAVLDAEKVELYRMQAGQWQPEQVVGIVHVRPWPRDLRGRLLPAKDHLLDVYLPGVICHSRAGMPLTLNCHESDDPWPLSEAPEVKAFFAPARNYFTGVLTPGVGKFTTVPKFYSAAMLPRDQYTLGLFAATDGQVHVIDGASDRAAKLDWDSDLTSVKTMCGAGWQVLAAGSGEGIGDSVRAYELPDRDPVAVSAAIDFPGAITALWTEARGDTAIAVVRNRETGSYEAFRLAVACSQ